MPEFTAETRFLRRPDLLCTVLDKDVVILNPDREIFYTSNEVGAHIWDLLEKPVTLIDILESVASEFEGASRTTMEVDTSDLLNVMLEKGIISEVA